VTITFWQFWDAALIGSQIARFEAENPGIRVKMEQLTWQNGREKILASVAGGTAPDLCELGSTWFARFAADGALADITAETDSLRPALRLWEAATYSGRVYGVPWVMGTRALFYNRTLFRRAGLDPDRPPETWSGLLEAVRKIHNPARDIYGYGRNSGERYVLFKKFMPFAWSLGGDVLSPDGRTSVINSPANLQALKFYLGLGPWSLTDKQDLLDQAFKQGRVGVLLSGAWLFKTIPADAPNLDYGVAPFPRPDDRPGPGKSFGGGELLVIFRSSKHCAEALQLARFLARPENALALSRAARSVQPAAVGLEDDPYFRDNPRERVFLEQLSQAVFPPNIARWTEVEGVVESWVEKALYGQVSPEEALAGADREITALLAAPSGS
jgi:multiple sugar transport system substrate-binding protein